MVQQVQFNIFLPFVYLFVFSLFTRFNYLLIIISYIIIIIIQ